MDMIEKVAEAMMRADWNASAESRPADAKISAYYAIARAAIEAMREPTEAMTKVSLSWEPGSYGPQDVWRAMIDAALSTRQEK